MSTWLSNQSILDLLRIASKNCAPTFMMFYPSFQGVSSFCSRVAMYRKPITEFIMKNYFRNIRLRLSEILSNLKYNLLWSHSKYATDFTLARSKTQTFRSCCNRVDIVELEAANFSTDILNHLINSCTLTQDELMIRRPRNLMQITTKTSHPMKAQRVNRWKLIIAVTNQETTELLFPNRLSLSLVPRSSGLLSGVCTNGRNNSGSDFS